MVFKFQFVTKVFAMKGIKIELLGIANIGVQGVQTR